MSTTTKFTPGPWVACERGDYADDGIVILGDDRRLAVVNTEDDAHLIAAATELYKALQNAIEALAMCAPSTQHGAACHSAAMLDGRGTLAKARGEG